MKKIFIICLAVALVISMVFIVKQANANDSYSNFYYSSGPDISWNATDDIYGLVDFYDYVHGRVRIHGTVYGYNPDVDNSSAYLLSKASVSIKMLGSYSDYFGNMEPDPLLNIDNNFSIMNLTKINGSDGSIKIIDGYGNWSYGNGLILNISNAHMIEAVNFSSINNVQPYIMKNKNYYPDYFEEEIIVNPGSEINYIKENPVTFTQLWRFTFSDENGEYEFDFLQPGTYEIEVNKIGYKASSQTITVEEGSSQVDFLLEGSYIVNVVDRVITPFNYSVKHIREISGSVNMTYIENAIISGNVGCEIVVEKNLESHVVIYSNGLRINATNIEGNKVSIKISGEEDVTGKTIVINVEGDFFDDHLNLIIEYDQEEIRMADDLDDILNPDDDGSHPEYLIIQGAEGTQIIVSIPHFSEHEITIYSQISETIAGLDIVTMIALYAFICTIATVIFIGSIGLRRRIR